MKSESCAESCAEDAIQWYSICSDPIISHTHTKCFYVSNSFYLYVLILALRNALKLLNFKKQMGVRIRKVK